MSKLRFKGVNEIACGFVAYLAKLWSRKWQPTPVFLPGNPLGGGAWWATVHGVTKSGTQLRNWAHVKADTEHRDSWFNG